MSMDIAEIHSKFNEQIYGFICCKVNHEDHCHDILQEVYIKIIMNLNKLVSIDNLKSYLLKIADNAIIDYYRVKSSCGICCEADGQEQSEITVTEQEEKQLQLADCCLQPFIQSLEPIYREALTITDLQGLTQREYAKIAGISLSGAKSRVQRAREQLKQQILACCNYQFDTYGNITGCCES